MVLKRGEMFGKRKITVVRPLTFFGGFNTTPLHKLPTVEWTTAKKCAVEIETLREVYT